MRGAWGVRGVRVVRSCGLGCALGVRWVFVGVRAWPTVCAFRAGASHVVCGRDSLVVESAHPLSPPLFPRSGINVYRPLGTRGTSVVFLSLSWRHTNGGHTSGVYGLDALEVEPLPQDGVSHHRSERHAQVDTGLGELCIGLL